MAEHIWTLYIIQIYNSIVLRLVKTQHIIPDSHNYYKNKIKKIKNKIIIKIKTADKKFI